MSEKSLPIAPGPWSRELIKEIAMDIGKEVVAHIETMYPMAVEATPSTFPLSVRNKIYNEIIAAIDVNDADQIASRLKGRKALRRRLGAASREHCRRAASHAEGDVGGVRE